MPEVSLSESEPFGFREAFRTGEGASAAPASPARRMVSECSNRLIMRPDAHPVSVVLPFRRLMIPELGLV